MAEKQAQDPLFPENKSGSLEPAAWESSDFPRGRKPHIFLRLFLLVLIITGVTFNVSRIGSFSLRRCWRKHPFATGGDKFNYEWDEITPTERLVWYPCQHGAFQCARFLVPLDWQNPEDGKQAAIAIIKYPADVDEAGEEWGGPVLLNPGGPGGSGVLFTLETALAIQNVIGSQFSIIGFDPRGVYLTTPHISCFNSTVSRDVWDMKSGFGRIFGSGGGEELGEAFVRAGINSNICNDANTENIALVGTAAVSRDMLAITDAIWKGHKNAEVTELSGVRRKQGLRYWGFSYGSILGTTFASMFPDRVERIVVDGVVDVPNYYATKWSTNIHDADKVMESFYTYCFQAGPLLCPFHTGTSPKDIKARLDKLLARLKKSPIAIPPELSITGEPEWITFTHAKLLVVSALYNPLQLFPIMAGLLKLLDQGIAHWFHSKEFSCHCAPDVHPKQVEDVIEAAGRAREAAMAIACGDGEAVTDDLDTFHEYWGELQKQSSALGDYWAAIRMSCVGWRTRASERINTSSDFGAETRFPLLFIGNTYDPVTPFRNAISMSKHFPGSGVLRQNSEGHCSISSPSICTAKFIKGYFANATLPPKDTLCKPLMRPFGNSEESKAVRALSDGDKQIVQDLITIGNSLLSGLNFRVDTTKFQDRESKGAVLLEEMVNGRSVDLSKGMWL